MPEKSENFFLRRATKISVTPGESGYFSAPDEGLDPSLFNGDRLHGHVRLWLLQTLYTYLDTRWKQPTAWCNAWIAGSGISHQWSAARGNGDLDILLGVDWPRFRQLNPGYEGLADRELATLLNNQLRDELWPRTALTRFGAQTYEVTWFINLNSADIRNIKPYAAYNLPTDTWTVRPPKLPVDPASRFPAEWNKAIEGEARTAAQIIDRYNSALKMARSRGANTGAWTNAMAIVRLAQDQATALYDDIHLGRREAFSEFGDGYADWHNYRWQSHKKNGIAAALHELAKTKVSRVPDTSNALISALTWRNT
ncbi:hypothetical protein AB0G15_05610 [Streptosporangium sp. NPDC023825]|uniref:hypothetical protein n=1 Tax=Streptosporangium sp. NPDC023825 TaxID=3154909 RepID=UPI00341E9146